MMLIQPQVHPIGSFGEYEVLAALKEGFTGALYKVRHKVLGNLRAIRLIWNTPDDPDFLDQFSREARILSTLNHPNINRLFEFGRLDEDTLFLIFEFIEGQSLIELVRQQEKIPVPKAFEIIRQVALGLDAAHHLGVIHRNLSPAAVMLVQNQDAQEQVKIVDFGIARPIVFQPGGNVIYGRPQFMSPEQCGSLPEGQRLDYRCDIYSLAAVFYFVVTGKFPFDSHTPEGFLYKHLNEIPRPPSTLPSSEEIPKKLDDFLLKALSKKREDRYTSIEEFIYELDVLASMEAVTLITPAPKDPHFLHPGKCFGERYQIEKRVGKGGMGTVYKAYDRLLDTTVALKTLNQDISSNENALGRLKREVILARRVAHPNACRIYDMGEANGIHFLIMEYLEGQTLSEILRVPGTIHYAEGIEILNQVLNALREAHRVGVVHRDLKPQNILIDNNGQAHIMDFGVSLGLDIQRITRTGILVGTPRYMAPEQFDGRKVDERADIYSLGMVMYEMFTGHLPFAADTPVAAISAHLNVAPIPPSVFVADIPLALEQIILKTLEKDPEKRFSNVQELLLEFEKFVK